MDDRRFLAELEICQEFRLPTFQPHFTLPLEAYLGPSANGNDHTALAHTVMVPDPAKFINRYSPNVPSGTGSVHIPVGGISSTNGQPFNPVNRLEAIGSCLDSPCFPPEVVELLLSATRENTNTTYQSAWNGWSNWCHSRNVDPMSGGVKEVLCYLARMFKAGRSYNTVKISRSMLSSTLNMTNDGPRDIDKHPLITQLIKGIYHAKPPTPKLLSNGFNSNVDVPVPIFKPGICPSCLTVGSMRIQCGPDEISVVTTKVRKDGLSSPEFECTFFHFLKKPSSADYMKFYFWPGTTYRISALLFMVVLSGSGNFSCSRLQERHKELDNKSNGINEMFIGEKYRDGESLYGNDIIEDDKDQLVHTLKLEVKLGKPSGETCGASSFQALRSENSKAKNLDITGIVMMTCIYGATVRITKMTRGESFSLTHMMHMKAEQMNGKFFCSDVVCKYSSGPSNLSFARNPDVEKEMLDSLCKWLDALLEEKGLTFNQLPGIMEQLKQQATIMEGELERELEGKSFMMKVLKSRVAKFSDSSKARSVEHHKMTQKKARIDKIIDRLNEKGVIVMPQHLDSGMLSLRYKEAIVQNQNEMAMFVKEWQNIRGTLSSDIQRYQSKNSYRNRTNRQDYQNCINRFSDCLSAEKLAESPFAQGDDFTDEFRVKEEDLLDGLGSGVEEFEDEGDFGYTTEATEDYDSDALDELAFTP
ncbi:Uncharacterized protein APZ42_027683 [Daphnia magna]|uniref:CxC3 like cysteine cluster domain-containing protein n=1 Tax=Daphnia magna TaxID=35525 RepID=A0A164R764_9CRUS|nr:Uncharacterized protein APZ42_027683 [Daphnia magna]